MDKIEHLHGTITGVKKKPLPIQQIAIGLLCVSLLMIVWPWLAGSQKFDVDLPVQVPLPGNLHVSIQQPVGLPVGETRKVEMALTWTPQDPSATLPTGLLEVRLDMPGVQMDPPGTTSQALQAGLVHHFAWQVVALNSANDTGRLWVYWRPLVGEAIPLMARPIPFDGLTFLGLGAPASRWVGGAGIMIAFILWTMRKRVSKTRNARKKTK